MVRVHAFKYAFTTAGRVLRGGGVGPTIGLRAGRERVVRASVVFFVVFMMQNTRRNNLRIELLAPPPPHPTSRLGPEHKGGPGGPRSARARKFSIVEFFR